MKNFFLLCACLVGLTACKADKVTATDFTVRQGTGGECDVVADLVATRDSYKVDIEVKACGASGCSTSLARPDGPFSPSRPKTSTFALKQCPAQIDRLEISASEWSHRSGDGYIDSNVKMIRFEKASGGEGRCKVKATILTKVGTPYVVLVPRDAAKKPLFRTLPFNTAEGELEYNENVGVACEQIANVEVQLTI